MISIREANEEELELVVSFIKDFYAIDNYRFNEEIVRAAVQQMLIDASLGRVYIIEFESLAIGYIMLTFSFSIEFKGRDAFIDEFYIGKEYRNRGYGKQTLALVFEQCARLGVNALHLEVERNNMRAQALYRDAGFIDHSRFLMTRWIK